jgi:DNA repair exonuclease SbcCD nuclease subunit
LKIIHTADWHLDSKLNALPADKAKERNVELLQNFKRVSDYAAENGVRAILISGDMFDNKMCLKRTSSVIVSTINEHPDINYYILKGNHDKDNFLDTLEEKPENLFTFGNKPVTYEEGRVCITGVELDDENVDLFYNTFNLDAARVNIVMLHGQEADSYTKDKAEVIPLRELKGRGIDYLALGHIHAYKEGELDSRGIYCYPGCLEGRGFDECGIHGFVRLDIDENNKISRTFVPFAKRKVYEIEVDVSHLDNSEDMLDSVRKSLASYSEMVTMAGSNYEITAPTGSDLVKVVLTGEVDINAEKDLTYILTSIKDDYYFAKIEDKTILHVEPRDYSLDESLRGEFVRTVLKDDTLSDEEKAAIIQCGIKALTEGKV